MNTRKVHPELPIFRLDDGPETLLYTPGFLVPSKARDARGLESIFSERQDRAEPRLAPIARQLVEHARRAKAAFLNLGSDVFEPECLTIYLSNQCNLGCAYCYAADAARRPAVSSMEHRPKTPTIDVPTVTAAARLVAGHAADKKKSFSLVLHGGGEPTLHWRLLQRIVACTRKIAEGFGVPWWGYIATNGIVSKQKAAWLAAHFDLIGLSCDGPPRDQDRQRPTLTGGPTSGRLAETARILRESGARFQVRITVTPALMARQAELVRYCHEELGAREIRLEPVYRAGGFSGESFSAEDAPRFVEHYLAAQDLAEASGCDLRLSGTRLDEIHGPHCQILKDVLHLTPDGGASACFLTTDSRGPEGEIMAVGRLDPRTGAFVLNRERIAWIRSRATRIPTRCHQCVNIYHCVRECPEVCPVTGGEDDPSREGGFRCRIQKELAERWIRRMARSAGADKTADAAGPSSFLSGAPVWLNLGEIIQSWKTLQTRFPLAVRTPPSPPWAVRGFGHDGKKAWRQLKDAYPGQTEKPMSVYVHLPFCDRHCGFCDCYSLQANPTRQGLETRYAEALVREIGAWSSIGPLPQRPVTTVHFGGGTPGFMKPDLFHRIVAALCDGFQICAETEWALESTTTQVDNASLKRWMELGFSRLHLGVQTLEPRARELLGRKEPASTVLSKLDNALNLGWTVSVDLLVGYPGQTPETLITDLERLHASGMHGVSVYRLNATDRNKSFFRDLDPWQRDPFHDFFLFRMADSFLTRSGYRKNHFTHYARSQDRNFYYTHADRGEDLLALGASADGIFGDYRYRHAGLGPYLRGCPETGPGLEGGLWENDLEIRSRPARAALMTGVVPVPLFRQMGIVALLDDWRSLGLVDPDPGGDLFGLTGNGSWYLPEMLGQIEKNLASQPVQAHWRSHGSSLYPV